MATPTKKRKEDRRIIRTRQLLRDALLKLIVETGESDNIKSYDAITIQDITDTANVARTTFYLHYKDKDELLFEGMREIYDDLVMKICDYQDGIFNATQPTGYAPHIDHIADHADFYRVMLSERGGSAFLMRVRDYLAEAMLEHGVKPTIEQTKLTPKIPLEMIAYSMAGSFIGMIKWWLDHDMAMPADELAESIDVYAGYGLFGFLNPPNQ